MLYISPDRAYIGYVRQSETTGSVLEYFIYSVNENRFVWTTPYDGNSIVDIIWTPDDNDSIAIISGTSEERASQLVSVGIDGTERLLFDMSTIFPDDVFISGGLNTRAASALTPFWITSPTLYEQFGGGKLVVLNHATGEIEDLCITDIETSLIRTQDNQFVAYEQANVIGRRLTIVSVDTGDFYRLSDNQMQVIAIEQIDDSATID